MCGIVGYVGRRPCRDLLVAGLEKLEYRGYDSAGISLLSDGHIDSVRAVGNLANLRAAVGLRPTGRWPAGPVAVAAPPGDDRPGPHPLGDPRPRHRGERPPARRLLGRDPHRPQRDRREPRRAAPRARRRGPRLQLRDRRRDRRPPDRAPLRRRPDRGGPRRVRRASRSLRVRRHARRPPRHPRRRPPGVPARSSASARARPSSPPRSPRSWPRPATVLGHRRTARSSPSTPEGARIIDAATATPVEREVEEVTWDEETAEKGGYSTFMLKEIHEQPDAVAETITDRLPGDDSVDLSELDISQDFLNDLRRIVIVACGTSYHAGLVGRYAIEQWARVPVEMDIASEYRYRDPVVGAERPGHRHHPVRRDGRHARGHAARARARREGAGAHQHHGEPGDPRRRRRPLHPRRPRDGRRGDEDLHRPDGGDVPARHLARAVSRTPGPGRRSPS